MDDIKNFLRKLDNQNKVAKREIP